MKRHTIKDNIISAVIGIAVGVPVALYARRDAFADIFTADAVDAVYAAESGLDEAVPDEGTYPAYGIHRQMHDIAVFNTVINEQNDEDVVCDDYIGEDLELLAALVHAEAGNQDMVGKRLVADVVLNRVASDKFPNTISGVIYDPGQFSPVRNGSLNHALNGGTTAEDREAARLALVEGRIDTQILYFCAGGYGYGTPAYRHDAHFFSK